MTKWVISTDGEPEESTCIYTVLLVDWKGNMQPEECTTWYYIVSTAAEKVPVEAHNGKRLPQHVFTVAAGGQHEFHPLYDIRRTERTEDQA